MMKLFIVLSVPMINIILSFVRPICQCNYFRMVDEVGEGASHFFMHFLLGISSNFRRLSLVMTSAQNLGSFCPRTSWIMIGLHRIKPKKPPYIRIAQWFHCMRGTPHTFDLLKWARCRTISRVYWLYYNIAHVCEKNQELALTFNTQGWGIGDSSFCHLRGDAGT